MADEGKTTTVSQEDMNKLRASMDSKVSELTQRAETAEARANAKDQNQRLSDIYEVNLEPKKNEDGEDQPLTPEQKTAVSKALESGKAAAGNLATTVNYALDQRSEVLSWEVASEIEALDDRKEIQGRIRKAKSPSEMDQIAREIKLEYKEDGKSPKGGKSKEDKDDNSNRQFSQGGSRGSGTTSDELVRAIAEIDPGSPDAQKELDKLKSKLPA